MSERRYYSHEAEMQARQERVATAAIFLMLGLGIGAILALLMAPQTGEEMRKELAHVAEDRLDGRTLERLQKNFEDLRDRVEDRIAHMR